MKRVSPSARCCQAETRHRNPAVVLAWLLAFVVPHTAAAQSRLDERVLVPDRVEELSAEQLRQLTDGLARIAAVLRANPAVASLPGPFPCAGIDTRIPQRLTAADRAHVGVTIYDIGDDHLCPGGGGTSVQVHVNSLTPLIEVAMGTEGELRDEHGLMYRYHAPIGQTDGFPEYAWQGGGTRAVLLTNRVGPMVTSVSRERYLRALIREWDAKVAAAAASEPELPQEGSAYERWLREEKPAAEAEREQYLREIAEFMTPDQVEEQSRLTRAALDQMERGIREMSAQMSTAAAEPNALRTIEARTRGLRGSLLAELNALSPTERAAPACIGSSAPTLSSLVDCGGGSTQIVNVASDFIDRTLPESIIQVLVVTTAGSRHMMESRQHFETRGRIFETLNYAALAGVLH